MEFLLGHISAARMSAKTLLLNWGVQVDVMHGVDMDKLIDRVLTFKKDLDGKFWLTHYAYVLLGRRTCDGMDFVIFSMFPKIICLGSRDCNFPFLGQYRVHLSQFDKT